MRYIGKWYASNAEKHQDRIDSGDYTRLRGVDAIPNPPRDVYVQAGPRGLFITWKLPEVGSEFIAGWRVYKDNENNLYDEIKDRANRQKFIETTSGTTPPVVNVFVSSINSLGNRESQKVQAQGSATAETGAPSMPSTPPGYADESSGGADRSNTYGSWKFNIE